jgi:hypothetical protein
MCYEYDTGILLRTTPYGIAFLFINLKYGVVFRSLFLFKMKERKVFQMLIIPVGFLLMDNNMEYHHAVKYRKNIPKKAGD